MAHLQNANLSINSSGENTVVAGVSGSQIRVYRVVMLNAVATAQTVTVKDKASGNTLGTFTLPSSIGGGLALGDGDDRKSAVFRTQSGGDLIFSLSAATSVTGMVQYTIV